MAQETLPSFARPPVVETVLGVQFNPLPEFKNAHLGAFWLTLGKEWPDVADAAALPPQSERFGDEREWGQLGMLNLTLLQSPGPMRIQVKNAQRDRMIQLQNGRFHYNWLGEVGGEYARFDNIRPEFLSYYERFKSFAAEHDLGDLRPNQWELTYVNHLPHGELWTSPENWSKLFRVPVVMPSTLAESTRLESVGGEWHYEIEPRRGRLHVNLQHGRKTASGPELLILTLTARGPITAEKGENAQDLASGLDLGRATIVKSFAALCSNKALQFWERVS